ncbi:MAG: DnaJ domain-containing protein [Alphaproteobacteria bacterium]|nr:DnaJ domain-containing protein [Alphaproteobacteria bacterium]
MKTPYDILGLSSSATADEIKSAYRRLARTWHPDSNSDPKAEERFKEISAAYHLLSDPAQRGRFDRGEIDASGQERSPFRGGPHGRGRPGGGFRGAPFDVEDAFDPNDLFSELFGARRGRAGPRARGSDSSYDLTVTFEEAANGVTRRLTLVTGKTVDVRIAAGSEEGQKLRLRGQGLPSPTGGEPGDALVEIKIAPHPYFTRRGNDVHVDVPVTLKEAVLGAKITIPTVDGKVTVTVPKGSNTGTTLRLKGKGIPHGEARGDQMVKLKVVLPEPADPQLTDFVGQWTPGDGSDPREKAGMA